MYDMAVEPNMADSIRPVTTGLKAGEHQPCSLLSMVHRAAVVSEVT
jgi:hypothetical protein